MEKHSDNGRLPFYVSIRECVGGKWMITVNGYQIGGEVDASGAGSAIYSKWTDALAAANELECVREWRKVVTQ